MSGWAPWLGADAPAALLHYVLPSQVKLLVEGGLPGPSAARPLVRLERVYDAMARLGIEYAHEATVGNPPLQLVRPPDQVLRVPRHGTCLDLAVTFAGACLVAGLHPLVVILAPTSGAARHAVVVVWLDGDWRNRPDDAYPLEQVVIGGERELVLGGLARGLDTPGSWVAIDPTLLTRRRPDADEPEGFAAAVRRAGAMLAGEGGWRWELGVDVGWAGGRRRR